MGWEFDVYGDPSNAFVKKVRSMGLVHPVISGSNGDEGYKAKHPLTDHQYPHGMVQPAILMLEGMMIEHYLIKRELCWLTHFIH